MLAVFLAFTVKLQIAKEEISDAGGRCERTRRRQTIPTSVGGQFLRRGRLFGDAVREDPRGETIVKSLDF